MTGSTKQIKLYASGSIVLLVALVVLLFGSSMQPDPLCKVASTWVKEHKASNTLPTDTTELLSYPQEYRKYIFNSLSPQDRSRFVREALTPFLSDTSFTAEQHELITRMIASASPELYASKKDASLVIEAQALGKKVNGAFRPAQRRSLNPIQRDAVATQTRGYRVPLVWDFKRRLAHYLPTPVLAINCHCTVSSYCESYCAGLGSGWGCAGDMCSCDPGCEQTATGCGEYPYNSPCSGVCNCEGPI